MRTTRRIAILVALAAVAVFTTEAPAMYHAGMGRFLQRDPGAGGAHRLGAGGAPAATGRFIPRDPTGSNQYADGMNLYHYCRNRPGMLTDPAGTMPVPAWDDAVGGPGYDWGNGEMRLETLGCCGGQKVELGTNCCHIDPPYTKLLELAENPHLGSDMDGRCCLKRRRRPEIWKVATSDVFGLHR